MGCEPVDSRPLRTAFHHVPDHVLCHPGTPQRPILPNRSKQSSFTYAGSSRPIIDGFFDPFRHGDGANVAARRDVNTIVHKDRSRLYSSSGLTRPAAVSARPRSSEARVSASRGGNLTSGVRQLVKLRTDMVLTPA